MKKLLLLTLILMVVAFSATKYPPQAQPRAYQVLRHNINRIEMCVSNFGKFGQDETGNAAGLWWPKGTDHTYIYGAGSWFGTLQGGDTLVTIGYGPSGGQAEYACGRWGWSVSDPDAVIFMYPENWPSTPPASLPMFPPKTLSHQDSWCVYNDGDASRHMPGDTRPIGLEVYQTVYAWNLSSTEDIIFVKYELKNVSGATLSDCYFGVTTDNDIGNEAGTGNDIISGIVDQWYVIDGESLRVDNLGYQWQEAEEAGNPPWWPGTIGFDYLQSPYELVPGADKDGDGILDQYEMDSAYYAANVPEDQWDVDGDGTPDWRDPSEIPQIGMTAFKRFTLDLEPGKDAERYVTMAGYNFKTLVYEPFDTVPPDPDDQRFCQASGPFSLAPDSIVVVLVGVMLAEWHDIYQRPDTALVRVDNTAQFIYDQNWLLPGPPPPPRLTCVPGDAQITLIWDTGAETAKDPYYAVVSDPSNVNLYDPYYREVDFEGYGVWKSLDGQTWQLRGRYDLFNNIEFEDITQPESTRVYARNTGLVHSYVDTDVRNGFPYYYAVSAYDYNWVKGTHDSVFVVDSIWYPPPDSHWVYHYDTVTVEGPTPLWFESGLVSVSASPRRDPVNYVPGSCSLEVVSGNPNLASNIEYAIPYPLTMVDKPIGLEFGDVRYDTLNFGGIYSVYLKDTNGAYVDSILVPIGNVHRTVQQGFAVLHGVVLDVTIVRDSLPSSQSIFESVTVGGSYPDTLVVPALPGAWASYFAWWPYRGNDYTVKWVAKNGGGQANSVEVTDMMTGELLPYGAYNPDAAHIYDSLADGWCFLSQNEVSDTLVTAGANPATLNTKYLFIRGGLVSLKRGGFLLPGDPRPDVGDEWQVHADQTFSPAPTSAVFVLHMDPAYYDSVPREPHLKVKVVPNPYLIHNEWQRTFNPRRIKFINLPDRCTIRIFNLNGELVRTLSHVSTLEPGIGEQEVLGSAGGDEWWDLLSDNRQLIASGVYIFHVQSDVTEQVGKFVVIR